MHYHLGLAMVSVAAAWPAGGQSRRVGWRKRQLAARQQPPVKARSVDEGLGEQQRMAMDMPPVGGQALQIQGEHPRGEIHTARLGQDGRADVISDQVQERILTQHRGQPIQ